MRAVLAALPIAAVLALMLGRGWSAVRAGVAGAAGAVVLAVFAFDFGRGDAPYDIGAGLAGLMAEAAFVSLTVIAIIGPALAVHHLQQQTGSTAALRAGLARLSPDPRVAALLVAWFFTLFLEGAAGFGTPIALAAPFLVAAGFSPVSAVTAALVGHAAGVSFGAVGTPVIAQMAASGLPGSELARYTAPYHAVLGWILMAALVAIVGSAVPGRRPPWRWGALAAVTFFVPYAVIARFVGPELPTLGAALVGATAFVGVVLILRHRTEVATASSRRVGSARRRATSADGPASARALLQAAAPYLALVAVVLVTRLVPPVRHALQSITIEWRIVAAFTGSVQPLYHPGVLLPLAFGAGALAQGATRAHVRRAVGTTNRQLVPVLVALIAMVTIARTMSHAGMVEELALAAAGVGAAWPLLAPAVGALGTFVTGSATASNILFTEFQATTAEAVDRPVLPVLGAQGFGAAVGNVICPHNVVAAAATVGLSGREGHVLKRTLPIALVYVAAGGLLALWFAR